MRPTGGSGNAPSPLTFRSGVGTDSQGSGDAGTHFDCPATNGSGSNSGQRCSTGLTSPICVRAGLFHLAAQVGSLRSITETVGNLRQPVQMPVDFPDCRNDVHGTNTRAGARARHCSDFWIACPRLSGYTIDLTTSVSSATRAADIAHCRIFQASPDPGHSHRQFFLLYSQRCAKRQSPRRQQGKTGKKD